ncbi:SMI1/KNR4 family protein [Rossellomorea marisflavi]|uniref:SMI1/KNR4 family protein n=1 Tax=Rossellomorea marisflavi TaxID=189381 RepID=UPI003458A688
MYKKIEEILNVKFPIDYVENFNKLNEFTSLYLPDDKEIVKINEYCSLDNEKSENFLPNVYFREKNILVDDLIPFAVTEYDDYICFYFIKGRKQEPAIVFFSYDLAYEDREEAVFQIADNFRAFLDLLR